MADLPAARYRHAAGVVGSTLVVTSGRTLEDDLVAQTVALDLAGGDAAAWTTGAALPMAVSDAAAFVAAGALYVAGGYNAGYTAVNWTQRYDGQVWTQVADLPTARGDAAGVAVGTAGYVIGGFTHEDGFGSALATVEVYDVLADSWRAGPALVTGRGDKAAVAVHGTVVVLGGEAKTVSGHSVPVESVEALVSGTWREVETVTVAQDRFRFGVAAAAGQESGAELALYVLGGQGAVTGAALDAAGSYYPVLADIEELPLPASALQPASSISSSSSTSTSTSTSTATSSTTVAASTTTTTPTVTSSTTTTTKSAGESDNSTSEGRRAGVWVGAAIAMIVVLAIVVALVLNICQRSQVVRPGHSTLELQEVPLAKSEDDDLGFESMA